MIQDLSTSQSSDAPRFVRIPVDVVQVELVCPTPDCGGYMHPAPMSLLTNPPIHQHKCKKCERTVTLPPGVMYPRAEFIPREEPE